jgi:hypothetical protein
MKEEEVILYVKSFFEKQNYRVQKEAPIHVYRVDILAEKGDEKYLVECKSDEYLRSHEIHVMIGQLVSKMHQVGSQQHYGLAMPFSLSTYLREFGIGGINALRLHLFVVGQGDIWNGEVFYLDTESLLSYVKDLRKNPDTAWATLITLRKKLN